MKKDFREAGIEVFVPEKTDRELIAKRILEELELGIVKDSTLKEFQRIIEKMRIVLKRLTLHFQFWIVWKYT